jgi:hypothetical protein
LSQYLRLDLDEDPALLAGNQNPVFEEASNQNIHQNIG